MSWLIEAETKWPSFADSIFKCIFWNKNHCVLSNMPVMFQIMPCWWTGDKPYSENMMAWFTDVYVRHSASTSLINASGTGVEIFRDYLVNTMAADAMVPLVQTIASPLLGVTPFSETRAELLPIGPLALEQTLEKIESNYHIFLSRKFIKNVAVIWLPFCSGINALTHWGRYKMTTISQTRLSNAFPWMKILGFRLKFHWSLFLWVQ